MTAKKIRVLSVDDHAFLAEGLRARVGMEKDMEFVGHASRAAGLVTRCRESAVDVVLLDIEMPGPDPFEAAAELRHQCPNVRTIILSAYVRDRYVDATVKAGAWGYLAKSDDPDTIISAIRDVAQGRFTFGPIVLERCRQMGRDDATGRPPETAPAPAGAAGASRAPGTLPVSRLAALTPRELQILRLIGKGLSRTEIAAAIFRSPKTVDAHRSAIMEKLAIHDRVELARFAIREGLVEV